MAEIEIKDIAPYNDEQAVEALRRASRSLLMPLASKILLPGQPCGTLRKKLRSVNSVDEFQSEVMAEVVESVIRVSTSGFSATGLENVKDGKRFLAVSNHRDIVLDPALTQLTLLRNEVPMTEICVGSNLLEGGRTVADLLRSNRMIKVLRGLSAREIYESSKVLSEYIRDSITSGRSSVWIAQREGRAKNGLDRTGQGILKMFEMSGKADFKSNFLELGIVPMSISYEYESCDIQKARETLIARDRRYVKKKFEDTRSIITGIRQWKGGVNLAIDKPLSEEEIETAASCSRNERYQTLCKILDKRILNGYKLWKTNYIAYDLMNSTTKYSSMYDQADKEAFKEYCEKKIEKAGKGLDREVLRDIFWHIYGNPVVAKEGL